MTVPLWAWVAALAVVAGMLAVDLLAHRGSRAVGVREAAGWSLAWVVVALAFGGVVRLAYGGEAASAYLTGYLVEKSLAVDNVFVIALLFGYFAVPRAYQHRVLFYGVLGALVLRGAFVAGGSALISRFGWVLYVFGGFLVLTGIRMLRHRHDQVDLGRNRALRLVRRALPSTDDYVGERFVVRTRGRWLATPLLIALVAVELTDVVFAVDSLPAVFGVTTEPFLVFTSNAFAILGLRAMYFLLADVMHRFVYLKAGLAAILVFVGGKMLLADVMHLPTGATLGAVAAVLTLSIGASMCATREPRVTDVRRSARGRRSDRLRRASGTRAPGASPPYGG